MIRSTIELAGDARLAALLAAEERSFEHRRAGYKAKSEGKRLVVEIEAEDATALKTVVSSVCRIVSVYEKAKGA